jgi:hypothetical protein
LGSQGVYYILSPHATRSGTAVRLIREQSVKAKMVVGIYETRQQSLPLEVDHFCPRDGHWFYFRALPHPENTAELHGQGLRPGGRWVHGQNISILENDLHDYPLSNWLLSKIRPASFSDILMILFSTLLPFSVF